MMKDMCVYPHFMSRKKTLKVPQKRSQKNADTTDEEQEQTTATRRCGTGVM